MTTYRVSMAMDCGRCGFGAPVWRIEAASEDEARQKAMRKLQEMAESPTSTVNTAGSYIQSVWVR